MENKKIKIFKICIFIALILILVGLTIKLIPVFKSIITEQGRNDLKNEIENMGISGIFIIVGLMIVQIFLVILPGEPVEFLAGMCYGPIGGLLVIYLGTFISTIIIFFAVKKWGRNFIYSFIEKEKMDKWEHSKLFSNKKKTYTILFLLFFTPGLPKDILVYLGGLLPINSTKFILISTFARFPSIITSTIAGSNVVEGNWLVVIGMYLITLVFCLIMLRTKFKDEKLPN